MQYCGPISGPAWKRAASSGKLMILHVARFLFVLLEVLILFNLLIVVHELGHFLAARWRGLYIEKFGIWFGKPLWKKTINGVQYSLGSLPFGGFVALPQLAPMDIIEGKADVDRANLPRVSALDKIIVAIAGPLFSLLLALVIATLIWVVGYPVSESDTTTTVGYIVPESPALNILRPGDKILEVDGQPVKRFLGMNDSVSWSVVRSEGDKIPIKFQRDGAVQTVEVEPYRAETRGWRRKSVRQLLILPAQTAVIEKVEPNTPAAGCRSASRGQGCRLRSDAHVQSARADGSHHEESGSLHCSTCGARWSAARSHSEARALADRCGKEAAHRHSMGRSDDAGASDAG